MKNNKIRSIYCHYDGYPEGVGKTLLQYYNSWSKIKPLIDLGDISSLGLTIGKKHDFDNEKLRNKMTTFYGRDRGEKGTKARVDSSSESYVNINKDWDIEYFYLYENDEWLVLPAGTDNWKPLKKVLGMGGAVSNEDEEEVHGEGNPYESKNKIKGKLDLQEAQMSQNNDTTLKIQREAKKTALRLYKTIYDNLFLASQALLEMPKEYIDGETFGPSGPFKEVYDKVKSSLDSMTSVNAPDSMTPEEVMPEPEPIEAPTEVPMGGEGDLEEVNIQ
jgi:hypothetical protein